MDLQRRLRGEDDARAAADVNRLRQAVAAEDPRPGADDDRVRGAVQIEHRCNPERRLGVLVRDDGAAAALLEHQLESGVSSDCAGGPAIARFKGSRCFVIAVVIPRQGEPFRPAFAYDS
jgi:hypothetical protein